MDPYLPYEYTCEGMLERIHAYIQHQVCGSPTLGLWGGAAPESEDPPLPGVQGALAPPVFLQPVSFPVEGGDGLLRGQQYCSETRPGAPLSWTPSSRIQASIS